MATAAKPVVSEVCPGVTLSTLRTDDPLSIDYHVEVARLKVVTFTMDFTGSENMSFGGDDLKVTVEVQPFERKRVCTLKRVNPRAGCSWKYSYSVAFADPDEDTIREYVKQDEEKIQAMLSIASSLEFGSDSASTEDLIKRCRANGVHYLDIEFPPSGHALGPPTAAEVSHVTWRRPEQFFAGEGEGKTGDDAASSSLPFDVFLGEVEPNDIRQGQLADCWFLCALAALAETPRHVYRVFVPPEMDTLDRVAPSSAGAGAGAGAASAHRAAPSGVAQRAPAGSTSIAVHANKEGVYTMRFCKNGQWTTVRVDDFFPCAPCGGPVYSKGNSTELWVLLLEKAYAKLHGSYHSLRLGLTHEALLDLTGCPTRVFRLDGQQETDMIKSGKMWELMERFDRLGFLMTCDTPGSDVWTESGGEPAGGPGLVKGHAYTLLRCVTVSTGQRLVFIRNPWGSFEWNGDWSDESSLWTSELQAEVGFVRDSKDGAFWMSYEDFLKYFVRLVVCRLTASDGDLWNESRLKGCFTRQQTAYGVPAVATSMFRLTCPQDGEVILGLHQRDTRSPGGQPYIDVGLSVMQQVGTDKYRLVTATGMEVDRQVQLEVNLTAGDYIVVPRTTGCKLEIADMTGPKDRAQLYNPAKKEFTPECVLALTDVFNRFDTDLDGVLARPEMNKFQRLTDGCDMGAEEYRFLCQYFDTRDSCLTLDGFLAAYKYIFDSRGCDEAQLWKELKSLGFNEQLELVNARPFVLSCHADMDPGASLEEIPFDAEVYEDAMEMPIMQHGKTSEFADGMIVLHSQMSAHGGLSFALTNKTTFKGIFTMDVSKGGLNMMSNQGSMCAEVTVEPGETEILHHLMVVDPTKPYKYPGYSISWRWEGAE